MLADRYDVRSLALGTDSTATLNHDSTDVVVLAAPQQPVSEAAQQQLEAFMDAGGSALLLVETTQINPQYPIALGVQTGLDGFLARHGVKLEAGMVFDMRSHANVSMGRSGIFNLVRGYPLWPIVVPAEEHTVTRNLQNLSLGWSGALQISDTTNVKPLWRTTDQGGLRPAESSIDPSQFANVMPDSMHTEIVAAAIDPTTPAAGATKPAGTSTTAGEAPPATHAGRMVVVADANFLEDQFVQANPQNLIFAANAVDWLAQDDALIRIRSKHCAPPALVFESDFGQGLLKWGNLVGMPALIVLIGLLLITGRRRRAMRAWGEAPARTSPSRA